MTAALLPSIDLSAPPTPSSPLPPTSLAHIGHAFAAVTPATLPAALAHLQRTLPTLQTHMDVSGLASTDDIITLLDAGAAKVVVSLAQLRALRAAIPSLNLDLDRVALRIRSAPGSPDVVDAVAGTSVGLFAARVRDVELAEAWLHEYGTDRPPVYVEFEKPEEEHVVKVARLGGVPVVPVDMLTVGATRAEEGRIGVAKVLLAGATSDRPDGLFTTLVTDERGVGLGVVYSSEKSVEESLRTGRGVYQSRKRGLWYKGETSGDVQELVRLGFDCDNDCLRFIVRQKGRGFCHLATATCFGQYTGLSKLQQTLQARKASSPEGSYTARLFNDMELLKAKIMEEANELCEAKTKEEVAFEAADLLYFALTKCIAAGVTLEDVERNLDQKSVKVKRRKGDAKGPWADKVASQTTANESASTAEKRPGEKTTEKPAENAEEIPISIAPDDRICLQQFDTSKDSAASIHEALQRPSQRSTEKIMSIVTPIIADIQQRGDAALLSYTHKFEKATSLTSPVLRAPFPPELMKLDAETIAAIDTSFDNIHRFHAAQAETAPLVVDTMPGVQCRRFARPIERVGLYVPGGTAVLPSTALMLGVPALVAGCQTIVLASPPRADGSPTPEVVYAAHKVGAAAIVLAGGAQAVAALAYGTESVPKVDKILGPGNQFVTAAKMVVANDTSAAVGIDMPAGPSEVLVVADEQAVPAFVAADLLSQAEHGVDSQVVLIAVACGDDKIREIEREVQRQAEALPRVEIVRGAIKHSVAVRVGSVAEAMELSNEYAPEHLILQVRDAEGALDMVKNAGSVFMGKWTPESVGDYSAGVNHSLPTYGYARQYSGVNLGSYIKHITASNLTADGLKNVGGAVMQLAKVEELEAHRRAVSIRLDWMEKNGA